MSLVPTTNNTLGVDYWNNFESSHGPGGESDEDGYYYTWDAAMNVCPSGWRLPSDNDWKVLEGHLGMTSAQQNANDYRGTDQGTKLKVGGSSGFEAKLTGYRAWDGTFYNRGGLSTFWTSTESSNSASAQRRTVHTDHAKVYRYMIPKGGYGFSVRCLKN